MRARAAIGLASATTPAERDEDAALLARVFGDGTVRVEIRQACFEALCLLAGRPSVVELDDTSTSQVQELIREIRNKKE